MQPIKQNVIDKIVENDLCCQCGVCVAMCPKQVLNMAWSPSGDLTPELSGNVMDAMSVYQFARLLREP